ncbi:hypothetical protein Tco_0016911 [Tanacetum coccineum]
MSTHEQQTSTIPTSVVRNTGGKSGPQNLEEPYVQEALSELLRPRKEGGVFTRLGRKEPGAYTRSDSHHQSFQAKGTEEGRTQEVQIEKAHSDTYEDDLSQPWTCEERNPFTTRIRHFDFLRTRMPSHVKTYDGSGDLEDHIKLFQSACKDKRDGSMPTWCHVFNSTLTVKCKSLVDKLPNESIDS